MVISRAGISKEMPRRLGVRNWSNRFMFKVRVMF